MIDDQTYLQYCFKTLADDTRMNMVRLLAEREYSSKDLAAALAIRAPTLSHHITKLRAVGFLTLRMEGKQHFYSLNIKSLDRFKQMVQTLEISEKPILPEAPDNNWIDALPLQDWEKKVIRDYTYAGRLKQLPKKEKKLLAILNWLALQFEEGREYTEREVNEIITRYHGDYAGLRRDLISFGYLRRERGGSKYWVTPEEE